MRVICINVPPNAENNAGIKVGRNYTVIEVLADNEKSDVFWYHLTVDNEFAYNTKYFIPLSPINETEFERDYKKELV